MDSIRRDKNNYVVYGARTYRINGKLTHKIAEFNIYKDFSKMLIVDKWLDIIYPCKTTAVN